MERTPDSHRPTPPIRRNLGRVLVIAAALGIPAFIAAQRLVLRDAHASAMGNTNTLYGVYRDFRSANVKNGHPDMQVTPPGGRGVYADIAADTLNAQGDPQLVCTGHLVSASAADASGRPIIGPKAHLNAKSGDRARTAVVTNGGAVTSADSFSSWFTDVPGVNTSAAFPITLTNTNGVWSVDGDLLTQHVKEPGAGNNKVYSYTFELETNFVYHPEANQYIRAGADDCMWVYVNNKLVIDLGGNHDYAEQYFEMSRLQGLQAGTRYPVKVFYAERTKGGSRFKLEANFPMNPVELPPTSGLND
jgi:fibro-slime domain-containing protein